MTESQTAVRPERRAELAAGLARVRARIADACAAAGRQRDEVTLVA
ncbi:YggS family pyridoxal phosphate-dependent enzyme, partial [Micromonospora tulbaghiae]